jgi:hypothetical protein
MNMQAHRLQLAHEAAKIMAEEGLDDLSAAKRKAAQRLRWSDKEDLPSNQEVEQALREYQAVFQADEQPFRLRVLREEAVRAMRFFERFAPLLVGPVAEGTAGAHSEIILHLFADTSEEVTVFLINKEIPYDQDQVNINVPGKGPMIFPTFEFMAGDVPMTLVVLPRSKKRELPRSPVDGRAMTRLSLDDVKALLVD